MKTTRIVVAFAALSLLFGCAQQKETAPAGTLNSVCVVSGEPIDTDSPTSDYMGGKVAFCCEKCQRKWNGLSDADKKAAYDKHAR